MITQLVTIIPPEFMLCYMRETEDIDMNLGVSSHIKVMNDTISAINKDGAVDGAMNDGADIQNDDDDGIVNDADKSADMFTGSQISCGEDGAEKTTSNEVGAGIVNVSAGIVNYDADNSVDLFTGNQNSCGEDVAGNITVNDVGAGNTVNDGAGNTTRDDVDADNTEDGFVNNIIVNSVDSVSSDSVDIEISGKTGTDFKTYSVEDSEASINTVASGEAIIDSVADTEAIIDSVADSEAITDSVEDSEACIIAGNNITGDSSETDIIGKQNSFKTDVLSTISSLDTIKGKNITETGFVIDTTSNENTFGTDITGDSNSETGFITCENSPITSAESNNKDDMNNVKNLFINTTTVPEKKLISNLSNKLNNKPCTIQLPSPDQDTSPNHIAEFNFTKMKFPKRDIKLTSKDFCKREVKASNTILPSLQVLTDFPKTPENRCFNIQNFMISPNYVSIPNSQPSPEDSKKLDFDEKECIPEKEYIPAKVDLSKSIRRYSTEVVQKDVELLQDYTNNNFIYEKNQLNGFISNSSSNCNLSPLSQVYQCKKPLGTPAVLRPIKFDNNNLLKLSQFNYGKLKIIPKVFNNPTRNHWKLNEFSNQCMRCAVQFTSSLIDFIHNNIIFKHHCRFCGEIICQTCLADTDKILLDESANFIFSDSPQCGKKSVKICLKCVSHYNFLNKELSKVFIGWFYVENPILNPKIELSPIKKEEERVVKQEIPTDWAWSSF